MKVRYEQQKGSRIKKGSIKYGNRRINNFWSLACHGYWWVYKDEKWAKSGEEPSNSDLCIHLYKIKNLKSAIRHIKKHDEVPKGTEFTLVSNFEGYNIYIRK